MDPCDLQTMARTYGEICQGETPWVALGNFMNDWFEDARGQREQLVVDPIALPARPTTELLRWAAFCAASVEWLCERYRVPRPSWPADPVYTLADPWFDDPHADRPSVHEWLLHDTPEPFRRRNVYSGDRLFEHKSEFADAVRQLRRAQREQPAGNR